MKSLKPDRFPPFGEGLFQIIGYGFFQSDHVIRIRRRIEKLIRLLDGGRSRIGKSPGKEWPPVGRSIHLVLQLARMHFRLSIDPKLFKFLYSNEYELFNF